MIEISLDEEGNMLHLLKEVLKMFLTFDFCIVSIYILCLFFSTARRPVRNKNRRSISSIHSAASTVSSEDGNTSEYPCSSSQRSTLGSNPEFNTQQLLASLKAASIENNITEQTSTTNKNIPNLDSVISSEIHNKEDIEVQSLELDGASEEDDETLIGSQVPSLTPREVSSLTSHPI